VIKINVLVVAMLGFVFLCLSLKYDYDLYKPLFPMEYLNRNIYKGVLLLTITLKTNRNVLRKLKKEGGRKYIQTPLNNKMRKNRKKMYLVGYRAKGIGTYKTPLKPLGYVVAGLGFACLGVGVFPNGLGLIAYPLGVALLGVVGIRINIKRKIANKIRLFKYKRGLI
jgi:hypothetical protein